MSKQVLGNQLFRDGLVTRVDENNFLVGERRYKVARESRDQYFYDYYCVCPAWKFDSEHKCKHCIAVELFEQNETQKFPKKEKLNLPTEDDD